MLKFFTKVKRGIPQSFHSGAALDNVSRWEVETKKYEFPAPLCDPATLFAPMRSFFHDTEGEFAAVQDGVQLDGVHLLQLDEADSLRLV